jgi:D-apionolactonase
MADDCCRSMRGLVKPIRLRAGVLDLELRGTQIAYVRLGDSELVRRIYVAVRDEAWRTILPELTALEIDSKPDCFAVRWQARHRYGPLDFHWTGVVEGASDGSLSYAMDGQAITAFPYGRIGICVLHGANDYAGRPFVARTAGSVTHGVFPVDIAPQSYRDGYFMPAIPEFESLGVQLADDLSIEFGFSGDLFETEDQRNWTDASFKTYSTPLRLGYPHEAVPGRRIRQRVAVSLRRGSREPQPRLRRRRAITIEVGQPAGIALPALGTAVPAANGGTLSDAAQALVRRLGLAYVRVDVPAMCPANASKAEAALMRGAAFARHARSALEVALRVNESSASAVAKLFRLLPPDVPLARVLVLDDSADVTSAAAAVAVRRGLRDANLPAPVGCGTPLWFADINRDHPDPSVLDFIGYGISPQLHLSDDASLMETLAVQGETVRKARAIAGGKPVVVGPVVLMPSAGGAAFPGYRADDGVDPRQDSLFCAAWTLGSLKQLALAGASAVTYFEALGPRGLIATTAAGGSRGSRSIAATPYPVHQVLAEVSQMSVGEILHTESSQPPAADALASVGRRKLRLAIANFSPDRREISVRNLPPGPATMRTLAPAGRAASDGCATATWVMHRITIARALRIELGGYGFARLDVPLPTKDGASREERVRTNV